MQPFVDDGLNGHTATKLVTPMNVSFWLAEDIDCPIVAEDVAMHDEDEDTVNDQQIDECDDMTGCNKTCAERVVNDEEVAQCIQFDRPPRRSTRNRPPAARIIKGLRSVRILMREAAKDFGKSVANIRVCKMIDLRRLPDVVKSEIL
ncbi:hypothetical protein M9H77_28456 [Catharanthus roseus]|uniref:Uncharacterized protein n=1 Tax=Catharanthus roseus TaxID=4058 RepID=A0ACC0AJP4_CATRO|nr:hypothetical protein M9H77_28456 [Catharanthus roseus]